MATYAEEQAEKLLKYYQGMSGTMRQPSELASPEERRAYEAQQVRAGQLPISELPEQYGGRPTGESRRAIRMQEAYDVEMARRASEERAAAAEFRAQEQFRLNTEKERYDLESSRKRDLYNSKISTQESMESDSIYGGLESIDFKNDPEAILKIDKLVMDNPLGSLREDVAKAIEAGRNIATTYGIAATSKTQKEAQENFAKTTQSLLEAGVPEEELVQYYDTSEDVPAGVARYNPLKVARKLGITKAEEKAQTKATKEETPKEKIGLDLQQAYGELNSALMNGEDTAAARSKVAGLRARYEAATGEAAPEVLPKLKTREEYDRLPAGTAYIGKDGKKRIKQ